MYAVALRERALSVSVDGHSLQSAWVIAQLLAVPSLYRDGVRLPIRGGNTRILSGLDAERLRPFRVANDIACLIVLRVLPVGSSDVLPCIENMHSMLSSLT